MKDFCLAKEKKKLIINKTETKKKEKVKINLFFKNMVSATPPGGTILPYKTEPSGGYSKQEISECLFFLFGWLVWFKISFFVKCIFFLNLPRCGVGCNGSSAFFF